MKGYQLIFSTLKSRTHANGELLSEWFIDLANHLKIKGVTILQASQGIGRDGKRHLASFFELSDEPIEIIFNVTQEECDALFKELEKEQLGLFYTKSAIEFGIL